MPPPSPRLTTPTDDTAGVGGAPMQVTRNRPHGDTSRPLSLNSSARCTTVRGWDTAKRTAGAGLPLAAAAAVAVATRRCQPSLWSHPASTCGRTRTSGRNASAWNRHSLTCTASASALVCCHA